MANKIKDIVPLSYNLYKQTTEDPVSKSLYSEICRDYLKFLSARLLLDGQVKLPERLGTVEVQGKLSKFRVENGQIRGLPPDWGATRKLWAENPQAKEEKRVLFHFNEETNGIRYKFHWSKTGVVTPNKYLYNFKACRTNSRELAKLIKLGKEYKIK